MENRIDFENLKGKISKLERLSIGHIKTKYHPEGTWFCKLFTEELQKIDENSITASRFLPMTSETEWKKLGDLQAILDFYKVSKPQELVGETVQIKITEKGGGKKWLEWVPYKE